MAEIDFDPDTYAPLPVYKPAATRAQIDRALDLLCAAERPLIIAGGGIVNADAADLLVELAETLNVPVIPTLMAWGAIPDDHPLMAGMVGLQTSHRYGNATLLESDFVLGIGNRWANRHTGGLEVYRAAAPSSTWTSSRPRSAGCSPPDYGIVSDAKAALELFVAGRQGTPGQAGPAGLRRLGQGLPAAQAHPAAADPLRPTCRSSRSGSIEEMNRAFDRNTRYVSTIGLSQIAGAQFLHVYGPRNWINCGQAGPLGWTLPAALGVCAADPDARSSPCPATTTSSS